MSPFDKTFPCSYEDLKIHNHGVLCVDLRSLLDILEKRAMLRLRENNVLGIDSHIADFNKGRYEEVQELYKVLKTHVDK